MKTYKATISIESDDAQQAKTIANLLQQAVLKVEHADIVKLLEAVTRKPSLAKMASKFV